MLEAQLISVLSKIHGNEPFLADAEIIPVGNGVELVSVDSFSEQEDFFTGLSPKQMGRQMAMACCSDILACGASPRYLLQAWNTDSCHDTVFYAEAASGIQEVLEAYGAKCLGGDMGTLPVWNWTGTAIGFTDVPIMRRSSKRIPFDLYASAPFGRANAAFFTGQSLPEFSLNQPVPSEALFATDSSGGFFDALENFRRANQGMHLEIDASLALAPEVVSLFAGKVEPALALVGGIGEYELLFAMPAGTNVPNAVQVGTGCFSEQEENEFLVCYQGKRGRMKASPPDYRSIDADRWLAATVEYWEGLFR